MAWTPLLVAGVAMFVLAAPATAQVRLEQLERLYFDRVAQSGELLVSDDLAPLIPVALARPELTKVIHETTPDSAFIEPSRFCIRDFALPARLGERRIWIREVVNASHPRISELWWAIYDGGRRGDVWYFTAVPDRTDRKILSNYSLESVSMPAKDVVLFRVQGDMFRPGGAWWVVGKELCFAVRDSSIVLERVRNAFGFFHSYANDDSGGSLSVSTEQEVNTGFEARAVNPVSEETARACRFQDPQLEDEWEFSWNGLEEVARCITSAPTATVTYRDFSAPSFIERAYTSEDANTR